MEPVQEVLSDALAGVGQVLEDGGFVRVDLPSGEEAVFRVESDLRDVGGSEPALLFLQDADPRTLHALRAQGSSFVTASGYVFLIAPGVYVDIRPPRPVADPDRVRNPFSARGRGICVALLLQPERRWTVRELASTSSASESFTSRVIAGLEEQGLVTMTADGIQTHADVLFVALAEHWPKPTVFFIGRAPRVGEAVISGGPAYEELGIAVPAPTRAYVATREQLRMLSVQTGSTPVTSRMAEWEAVLQPLPLHNLIVPPLICALELMRDPRGREVLRDKALVPWPIAW